MQFIKRKLEQKERDLARTNRNVTKTCERAVGALLINNICSANFPNYVYRTHKYATSISALLTEFSHTSSPVILPKMSGVNTTQKTTKLGTFNHRDNYTILEQAKI